MIEPNQQNIEAKQQIIDELLLELPQDVAIELELPSECRIYTLPDPGAPVTLRPMTFEDEKILVSNKKGNDPINLLLSRCTSNINISELLPLDKLYIIMKLREISYGDEYKTLQVCSSCKAENQVTIKLSQLNVNPVPDDFTDPVSVFLPILKKNIKVKLPRVRDEKFLQNVEDSLDQLWRFVAEIEGHTDKSIIAPVISKLPLKDSRTLLNALKTDFGIDTKIKVECNSCGGVSIVDLPITANFFDVN